MHPRLELQQRLPLVARWRAAAMLGALMAIILVSLLHLRVIDRQMPSSNADVVPVWVGTRSILAGHDPYSEETTSAIQQIYYGRPLTTADHANKMSFAYPPHTGLVLAPLALLSWERAQATFLIVCGLLMLAAVPLWVRALSLPMSRRQVLIATTLACDSWPVMWGLRLQQPTLLVFGMLAAGSFLLSRRSDSAAGLMFALSTIKPQLVGPLLLWLLLWTALQRRWRFGVSCLAFTSLLLAISTRLVPGWFAGWRYALSDYLVYTQATPILQTVFGRVAGAVLMLVIAATVAMILWQLRECEAGFPEFRCCHQPGAGDNGVSQPYRPTHDL